MAEAVQSARVVHVSLDEPLEPLAARDHHTHVLLLVSLGGRLLGQVLLPAPERVPVEQQRLAIADGLGEALWSQRLRLAFTRAARGSRIPVPPDPSVSVVVGTDGLSQPLKPLLDCLLALEPRVHELIVVESSPGDDSVRELCTNYAVSYLREPRPGLARAWNRGMADADGEVVALLAGQALVDRRWLGGLGEMFADPLVAAVAGYTAPLELEIRAGRGAKPQRGLPRGPARAIYDLSSPRPPKLREGNCFIRRTALAETGLFAKLPASGTAELYRLLMRAGYRLAVDPARIAWRGRTPARRGGGRRLRLRGAGVAPVELGPCGGTESGSRVVAEAGPPLSVAIASYNRREPLARVLGALAEQSYPSERFEVLVVLDGSTDGSAERVRGLELPYSLRLLEQENRGLAASRNRGGREAGAPVVVFLDDDIVPEPQFLAEHASAHRADRGDQVVLGSYPPARQGPKTLQTVVFRHWWEDYFRRRSDPDHQWTYMDFSDGNVSFPRSLLLDSGGWDEQFARETVRRQDWEFGIRLLQRGVRFVDRPRARGAHHFNVSFETSLRHRRVEGSSDVVLGRKHPQIRGHLVLARMFRTVGERTPRGRLARFAYRHPGLADTAVAATAAATRLLDHRALGRQWWALADSLANYHYIVGVRDALPTLAELREFMAPVLSSDAVTAVPVHLDREGPIDVPPIVGGVELAVAYGNAPLARVAPLEPEISWDWDIATERVVREALEPFKHAVGWSLEELAQPAVSHA